MSNEHNTLLKELHQIDQAVWNGDATEEQEQRGQRIVTLANAAPELLDALTNFFNIMHDYESSVRKGYVKEAMRRAREAIMLAKGGVL
jgi:hypothetical protein